MSRFFVTSNNILGNTAQLCSEDSAHAVRVLRLGVGDTVTICDCNGSDYDGKIIVADKSNVTVELSNKRACETESAYRFTLVQCLPKSGKPEVIIQKCTELGVYSICFVTSMRSVINIDKKAESGKLARYNKVANEAAKQSQRGIIPEVLPICDIFEYDFSKYDMVIVPYEEEQELSVKRLINEIHTNQKNIAIVIGPEGGFDKKEIEHMTNNGGICVTLGKRILRTETAGMATLAMLFAMLEG